MLRLLIIIDYGIAFNYVVVRFSHCRTILVDMVVPKERIVYESRKEV